MRSNGENEAFVMACDLIEEERRWQDRKWGTISGRVEDLTFNDWWAILLEELGEAAEAFLEYKFGGDQGYDHLLEELVQAAAVAQAMVEWLYYKEVINE